jgi:hypothetical protein
MSKLMTDSKTLTDLLDPGLDIDDNLLTSHIDALKQCAFDCMEIQVAGHVMTEEKLKEKTTRMGRAVIEAWQMLSALKNDFIDMLQPQKKGGEK